MDFINREFLNSVVYVKKSIKEFSSKITESPILFKSIVVFGFPGSGKTNFANWITKQAIKYYGINNVNARRSENGSFDWMLRYGVEPKLVNILFVDNATLSEIDRPTLRRYFSIRHHHTLSSLKQGYVLSIVAVHRFHGAPLEIRTLMDGLVVLDSTLNPYDRSLLIRFCGEEVVDYFDSIAEEKHKNPRLKGIAFYRSKNISGFIRIPFVKEKYIKGVLE